MWEFLNKIGEKKKKKKKKKKQIRQRERKKKEKGKRKRKRKRKKSIIMTMTRKLLLCYLKNQIIRYPYHTDRQTNTYTYIQ